MAEIQTNSNSTKRGVTTSKKLSTRIDLTPMVDLGFLLITFFIFTTTMASPVAVKLVLPNDTKVEDPITVSNEKVLTILVSKSNSLYYYEGDFKGEVIETNYKKIRDVIITKKQKLLTNFGSPSLTCLIKVTDEAIYKNVVDCLDEMTINQVATFMVLDPHESELHVLNKF